MTAIAGAATKGVAEGIASDGPEPRQVDTSFTNSIEGNRTMCCEKSKCRKLENLKGKPEDCTPAQIRKCHGTAKKHPCTKKSGRK